MSLAPIKPSSKNRTPACGACHQAINEFSPTISTYLANKKTC